MRLLIDIQGLQTASSRNRGIGRYIRSLSRAILRNATMHDVHFLLNDLHPETLPEIHAYFSDVARFDQFHIISGAGVWGGAKREKNWHEQAAKIVYQQSIEELAPDALLIGSIFEGGGGDAFVSCGPENCITAVVLYDLIPLIDPSSHLRSASAYRWYFNKIEEICGADLLLGISHSACTEAHQNLAVDGDKVQYIGAAASEEFVASSMHEKHSESLIKHVLRSHGICRPFVMHTSAFDDRKNFQGLITAFGQLSPEIRDAHQLVLVCKLNPRAIEVLREAAAQVGLSDQAVILTGFVPDDELRILYSQCKLFAFPSLHEGFGLPVLEAMWCGAPVVGSDTSSLPEVIGRQDAQFDPLNISEIARVVSRALSDEAWRQELIEHASAQAQRFSWDEVARCALAAIEVKLRERPSGVWRSPTSLATCIERIAQVAAPHRPTQADLLSVARALAANERANISSGDSQSASVSGVFSA